MTLARILASVLAIVLPLASAAAEPSLPALLGSTHVHGLAVDRTDSDRLLVATHHGLFAVTVSTGAVEPVSELADDFMGVSSHPDAADLLYASGHPQGGGNAGVLASNDGGRSWTKLSDGVGGPVDFHQMDVSAADPEVLYGVYGDLQVSRDGGRSWEIAGPVPEGTIDIAASAIDAARLYAATRTALHVSEDGGRSWKRAREPAEPTSLVVADGEGGVIAFALGSGLIRADEATLDWQPLNTGFGDRYLLHLAIDPGDPERLFATTQEGELLASGDGGRNWSLLAEP